MPRCASAEVPVEPVVEIDRTAFVDTFVDDPVNRQLGRVVAYQWGDRGILEQPGLALRLGPAPRPRAPARIPTLGQHTAEVLEELGFDADARAALAASHTVRVDEKAPHLGRS